MYRDETIMAISVATKGLRLDTIRKVGDYIKQIDGRQTTLPKLYLL